MPRGVLVGRFYLPADMSERFRTFPNVFVPGPVRVHLAQRSKGELFPLNAVNQINFSRPGGCVERACGSLSAPIMRIAQDGRGGETGNSGKSSLNGFGRLRTLPTTRERIRLRTCLRSSGSGIQWRSISTKPCAAVQLEQPAEMRQGGRQQGADHAGRVRQVWRRNRFSWDVMFGRFLSRRHSQTHANLSASALVRVRPDQ